jgi:sulfur-carrier protein adenylyltransferase/sulfurtransferase
VNKLTSEELKRYSRHLVLENFGFDAQLKLKTARVLVIGAGGLGCPALQYLAAAGVGTIGIVDDDIIDESNLQRQVLYASADVGKSKAAVAGERLRSLNPFIRVTIYPIRLTSENCLAIVNDYDIVLDGSDNFPTRYLVNDACVLTDKPLVYGSILKYEGQLAVFNVLNGSQRTTNYRDLFPEPPNANLVPNCEQAGVLGVLPGILGSMMAAEALKLITSTGELLINQLLIFDLLNLESIRIKIPDRNTRINIHTLIDYDLFCGSDNPTEDMNTLKEVTVQELKIAIDSNDNIQLIDVREGYERQQAHIGGEHIPLAQVPLQLTQIETEKKVIVYCRSGIRSANIIQWLEHQHGLTNLYNLKGGILAWKNEIDPSVNAF